MLRHADIWRAIDALAAKYGMSPSGLARRAGLDPTTFNKSKRVTAEGKLRWPSTESVAKILAATGASLAEFVALVGEEHAYALEVSGDSMTPVYRDGDIIVVSPESSLRRGDRVVLKTTEGEVMAKELVRQTARKIELSSINKSHDDRSIPTDKVAWMARIIWASQ